MGRDTAVTEAIGPLKSRGFDAIYIERAEYQDQGLLLYDGCAGMGMNIVQGQRLGSVLCVFGLEPNEESIFVVLPSVTSDLCVNTR